MKNEKVPASEISRQLEYADKVREILPAGRKYHIVTLGCQMNVRDSESLAGLFERMGFAHAETREDADLILYNTCCVRENAENKALGNVIWLKELKKILPAERLSRFEIGLSDLGDLPSVLGAARLGYERYF